MQNQLPQSTTPWKFYLLYASTPRGWNPLEEFHVDGQSWKVVFRKLGPPVPFVRMKGDETLETKIDQYPGPCVEIIVDTNEMDVNKAINLGRPIADTIAAILMNRLSTQIISKKIWAGIMGTRDNGSLFLATGENIFSFSGAPLTQLKERASELSSIDLNKLASERPIIPLSYRWFLKGLSETDINDKFISLWLSAVALYTNWCDIQKAAYSIWLKKQKESKDTERNKIKFYLQNKLKLSEADEQSFYQVLCDSYDLRIKIFHKSKIDVIKDSNIVWLARAVGSILWFEMGFPIGGSPAILLKNYSK
jgi:hypothetical protein